MSRWVEWRILVNEILTSFVDQGTDKPLPGYEEHWSIVIGYKVQLIMQAHQWPEAERLQRMVTNWERQRAASALLLPPETLHDKQRDNIRALSASLELLGSILWEQEEAACVEVFRQALDLARRIGDRQAEAIVAFNLGHAYLRLSSLRNIQEAERWYQRALELQHKHDYVGRVKCLTQLGWVALERFKEALTSNKPAQELSHHLSTAANFCYDALDLFPQDGGLYDQLGSIFSEAGYVDRARTHYQEAIRYEEIQGNVYGAARSRFNLASTLRKAGQLPEALLYAQAALQKFCASDVQATAEIERTQKLIARLEQEIRDE